MLLEVGTDAVTETVLDLGVRVDEAPPQVPSQLTPDSGFATAGHAHQNDHWVQAAGTAWVEIDVPHEVLTPPGEVVEMYTAPLVTPVAKA